MSTKHAGAIPLNIGVRKAPLIAALCILPGFVATTMLLGIQALMLLSGTVAAVIGGIVIGALNAWLVTAAIAGFRYSASLEGTVLVLRSGLRVHRRDLARANILLGEPQGEAGQVYIARHGPTAQINSLTVWEGDGKRIRIRMADSQGRPLPPEQLLLLADAIDSGGPHPGRLDKLANDAVAKLRACAEPS